MRGFLGPSQSSTATRTSTLGISENVFTIIEEKMRALGGEVGGALYTGGKRRRFNPSFFEHASEEKVELLFLTPSPSLNTQHKTKQNKKV